MFEDNMVKFMEKYNFEKLEVYQLAKELVKDVYDLVRNFPKEEIFVLCAQVKRAVISVTLNIAEGSIKTKKDFARFIDISLGSLIETKACLEISLNLNYVNREELISINNKIDKLFIKLLSLKKYLKS